MVHAAILPSLTASTAVSAVPAKSPPQKTPRSLVSMVSVSTSGVPQLRKIWKVIY